MSGNPVKILLVDDDEDDFIITRDLITRIGHTPHEIDWVNNYDDALTAIRRAAHDICLLDYRLGGQTGLELLRETQPFHDRPPVILLTGQGDREIDVEAMRAGAADYLIKSQLNADMLERTIRYAIRDRCAQENLRRERDLISRIMETSPVGIVVTDQSGKITFANQHAEIILGLTKDMLEARTADVLDWHLADADGNPLVDPPSPLKQVLQTGQPVQDVCHTIEVVGDRRTLLSVNATPLLDATRRIDGLVVTIEDTTERLALEAQLRQSQKLESVGQLAAGMAHDINNILTVIQGHAGLVLGTLPPNGDAAQSLKQICTASERAAGFIRHLLMFSRKQVCQIKILDLNAVLRNLEYMLPRMLAEHITLQTSYQPGLPPIAADTSMMEQIVINLMVNARDAMPKGGKLLIETAAVEIGPAHIRQNPEARAGAFICLTVTDTGCGMERKVLQRIFEPFFTTKEIGKGTGIGLSTVYGIVQQHHGWVEVASEVGVGTTFKIFLPVALDQSVIAPVVSRPQTINGGEETVLVVEDEIHLLEMTRRVLERYHYRVLTAPSGDAALQVWEQHNGQIDLLLADMIMPGDMTGTELAAELKKRRPALKVIITSGYSAELVGKDFGQLDIFFLAKPYQPQQVARLIRATLDTPSKNHRQSAPLLVNGVHPMVT